MQQPKKQELFDHRSTSSCIGKSNFQRGFYSKEMIIFFAVCCLVQLTSVSNISNIIVDNSSLISLFCVIKSKELEILCSWNYFEFVREIS